MRRTRQALAVVLPVLSLLACSTADEVKCPPGYGLCGASCLSLLDDEENCGACGNACGAGNVCSAGSCVLDCAASLRAPIHDRWGTAWDGLERAPATLADAKAACEAIGGRLPIATEIHRVSWARTADVGQSYQANYLWTLVPRDATQNFALRMSDGTALGTPSPPTLPYRCACPAAAPDTFSGYACNGDPGQGCFALTNVNAGYAMDAQDRAALSVGGAMWECGFAGGQLPRFITYAEAILQGLPNGSAAWLHTADLVRYHLDAVVRWTGTQESWPVAANTSYSDLTTFAPFRCVGRSAAVQPSAARPADAFVGPTGSASDAADRASAAWALAQSACWNAGGHLPFPTELGAHVQLGLGGGSGNWLWTADQEGWNGTQFLAAILRWTGTEVGFGHAHPANVTWAYKSDLGYSHRCVYYPVDPAFVPPTGCNGGCAEFAPAGTSGAKLWFDAQDRQAASFIAAVGICRGLGAHLPNMRDYTEAIRSGLANGSAAFLHSSDVARGDFDPVRPIVLRWTTVDGNFSDQYSTYMTWAANLDESRPYRCVWTNEVR